MLRAVGESGAERSQLRELLRLSKRAVRSNVALAERRGWAREVVAERGKVRIELGGSPGGLSALVRHGFLRSEGRPGQAVLLLTAKGQQAADAYQGHVAAVEEAWSSELGVAVVRKVRQALEAIGPPVSPSAAPIGPIAY
jgi:hypothetical protein